MNGAHPRLPSGGVNASAVVGAILALTGATCDASLGPGDEPASRFVALPDTVAGGDTLEVIFTLRNPTSDPLAITSSYGCLFFLEVLRGEEPVSMHGAGYACLAVIRTFVVAPRDSLHIPHQLIAAAPDPEPPYGPGDPLPPGTYRVRTRMNAPLPDLEARVTVVD